MSFILHFCVLFICIILQLTIIPFFSIKDISPNILLIVIISIAIRQGKFWGVIAGFFTGLAFDAFSTAFLGLTSLANSVSAFLAGFLLGEHLDQRFLVIIGLVFACMLVHDFIYYMALAIGTPLGFLSNLLENIIPRSLYTLLFMIIMHLAIPKGLWGHSKKL